MNPDDARHGTRQGFREMKCGCEVCKRAMAREKNLYLLRRRANGGRPLKVSKVGAVRRVHALMVIGWSRRELARQAGYQGDAFGPLLCSPRQSITIENDQRIRDLYDRLSMTPGPSDLTRQRAAGKGWGSPLAWDDDTIDDPDASPMSGVHVDRSPFANSDDEIDEAVVLRLLAQRTVPATKAERCEAMRRWLVSGRSEASLCEIHGWKDGRYVPHREDVA